jgi:hypothetical protein
MFNKVDLSACNEISVSFLSVNGLKELDEKSDGEGTGKGLVSLRRLLRGPV